MTPVTRAARSERSSAWAVVRVLFVFSPVLVPVLIVIAFVVMFLVLMVVEAFGHGFAVGCASLAASIGLPSLGLLWLSAAIRVFGPKPIVSSRPTPRPLSGTDQIEARYRSGYSTHRDYHDDKRDVREG